MIHQPNFILFSICGALISIHGVAAQSGPILNGRLIATNDSARFALSWEATQPGAFKIQATDSLGTGWSTVDIVQTGAPGMVQWVAPRPVEANRFFQLQPPRTEIFAIEPAIIAPNVPIEVYLLGQCFSPADAVSLDNTQLEAVVFVNQSTLRLALPAQSEGLHRISVTRDGELLAAADLLVTDPSASPNASFQELFDWPPASPGHFMANAPATSPGAILLRTSEIPPEAAWPESDLRTGPAWAELTRTSIKLNDWPGTWMLQPFSAEIQHRVVDLRIPGRGMDFVWARTYRSRTGRTTPMGHNWDHSYNIYVERVQQDLALHDGAGRRDILHRQQDGTYARAGLFYEVSEDPLGRVKVQFPWMGAWEFNPFDGSAAAGKISASIASNGHRLVFAYDDQGRLQSALDDLGRALNVAYNPAGFVASITDFAGRTVTYQHNEGSTPSGGPGDLVAITTPAVLGTPNSNDFPAGKTTIYTYTKDSTDTRLNHNLLSVTDPQDQTWLRIVYHPASSHSDPDFDAVDHVQRPSHRIAVRRSPQIPSPENRFATLKCVINDENGHVTEVFFDSLNRLVRELRYTGRANAALPSTETENRPAGPLRPDDPDRYETRWAWNVDSLPTRVILPRGTELRFIYERDFDALAPNTRKGDLRVLRQLACRDGADTDSDGHPDLTERTWRMEYDPRFGSPDLSLRTRRAPNAPTNGFVTALLDPRETQTRQGYNQRGKLIYTLAGHDQDAARTDYAYDTLDQLESITHPSVSRNRRRVDSFAYSDASETPGYLTQFVRDHGADGLRLTTRYEYIEGVVREIDPRGYDTFYTYNALNQLTRWTSPCCLCEPCAAGVSGRYTIDFTYDANDNLLQTDYENRTERGSLDPVNPHWTTFARYDPLNRRVRLGREISHSVGQPQPRFAITEFAYDGNDNLIERRSPEAVEGNDPDNVVRYEHDERDLLYRVTRAPRSTNTSTQQFDYDANGNASRVLTGLTHPPNAATVAITAMTHDGFNRLATVRDPLGNLKTIARDATDNLISHRLEGELEDEPGDALNLLLSQTVHEYDHQHRLTRSRRAFFDPATEEPIGDGEALTTVTRAPNGAVTSRTDDNASTTRYEHDSADRVSLITLPDQSTTAYSRDAADNIVMVTQTDWPTLGIAEQRFVLTHAYDGLNRMTRSVDNVQNTNRIAYDSRGNAVSQINPRGYETVQTFDGLGRMRSIRTYSDANRAAAVSGVNFEYDGQRLVSRTDMNGNTTRFLHDALDRCIEVQYADLTTRTFQYDSRDNITREHTPNDSVILHSYDLLDRRVDKDIAPGPGVAHTTTTETFRYDGLSRLVQTANDTSLVRFAYDSLDHEIYADQDGLSHHAYHDGVGNRLVLTYPGGREVYATYDSLNRLMTIASSPSPEGVPVELAVIGYEGPNRLGRIARANGINTRINWNGLADSPNPPGDYGWQQMRRINHSGSGGGPVVDQRTFLYDRAQNKMLRSQVFPFAPGIPAIINQFGYDAANRLLRAARQPDPVMETDRTYHFDAMGNRQRVNGLDGSQVYTMDPTLPAPGDAQMNRYTFTPFGQHLYDLNGNIVLVDNPRGGTVYTYDYADRLVAVDTARGPALAPVARMAYDALGRRIARTTYPATGAPAVTTRFVYDGRNIIETREGQAPPTSYVRREGSNDPLVAFLSTGATAYYHVDDLGNVLALTDHTGNILEHYDYDDFGTPRFFYAGGAPILVDGAPATASPLGNPFLFHGMVWEDDIGLYREERDAAPWKWMAPESIVRKRYYNPNTGRYISRDETLDLVSNPYTFAGNNPWTADATQKELRE